MQPTSDKEFDKIFEDGLEDFTVTPSKELWPSIQARLDKRPVRQNRSGFWLAAASVVILITAGLYFFTPRQKIWLHKEGATVAAVKPEQSSQAEKPAPVVNLKEDKTAILVEAHTSRRTAVVKRTYSVIDKKKEPVTQTDLSQEKPAESIYQEDNIVIRAETGSIHTSSQQPAIAAMPVQKAIEESSVIFDSGSQESGITVKPRIKSVGDLVNFVIAKVDQRDDKIIEMSQNDEGTSISGINLGVLKIKAEKNKTSEGFKLRIK